MDKPFHFSEATYPQLPFPISAEEISGLKEKGLLTGGNLPPAGITGLNPLEKLLYALVWKNGNLGKLQQRQA